MRRQLSFLLALLPLAACGGDVVLPVSQPLDTPTVTFQPYIPEVDTGHLYDTDAPDTDVPDTDVPDTDTDTDVPDTVTDV